MVSNVIETNIVAVANDPEHESGYDCHITCYRFLYEVMQQKKRVLMDTNEEIFQEYLRYASLKGQPHLGDAFVKWLHNNRGFETIFERVDTESLDFSLPETLQNFDPSDLKFLKVAIGTPNKPATIFNATDSDWLIFETEQGISYLENHQISLNQSCRECLKNT